MTTTTSNGISVGDRVRQVGKARRCGLKVTRVTPGGNHVICVGTPWCGKVFSIRADRLRKVEQ